MAKGKRGRPPNAAATAEMARLRDAGLTLAEIGARMGVSRQAVHTALARSGYQLPERPRPTPEPAEPDRPADEPAKARQPGPQAEGAGVSLPEKPEAPKRPRGLAAMAPERRREIARMGGRAVQAQGKGHTFTPEEAAAAGRKGGRASARRQGN
jgi:general stress protein YciG